MDFRRYQELYRFSLEEPEKFWAQEAEKLHWFQKWDRVKNTSFTKPIHIEWFIGGKLNVSYNCIDRHLEKRADKIAIIFEPDSPDAPSRKITYRELYNEVSKMASVLKNHGVKKGDCVTIYLPMIPEAIVAMHACNRIGAKHNVVFGGFSPDSIADRIIDSDSRFVITADEGLRGGKKIPLKANMDEALEKVKRAQVQDKELIIKSLVIEHTGAKILLNPYKDLLWSKEKSLVTENCAPEIMDAEDPLFILYTSGSTGKPKGVLHTTGGYLTYVTSTFQNVFDHKDDDIFWCTADVGWITGHSYIAYGPLSKGATVLIYEGVPHYPNPSRFWNVIDKHQVTVFYTAPTAIRSLMRESLDHITSTSRKSLRLLGSVGEPINPDAWSWYHKNVGSGNCDIVDTWWQTETGGILISPLPGVTKLKPGSATLPLFGIKPELLTPEGKKISGPGEGVLVLSDSWPGQMRTVYKNHERFEAGYFSAYPGYYFTGDGCKRDEDEYYWITGRVDDVLNVAGHRIGTAEVESAIVSHPAVAEAAVVGFQHDIKGQGIYAFVTLKIGQAEGPELKSQIIQHVRKEISPIATPDLLQWAPGLPKTRSGKIMRRILRKIAEGETSISSLGDITTLADPSVVESLIKNRLNLSPKQA